MRPLGQNIVEVDADSLGVTKWGFMTGFTIYTQFTYQGLQLLKVSAC